jgi:hypothetical protein
MPNLLNKTMSDNTAMFYSPISKPMEVPATPQTCASSNAATPFSENVEKTKSVFSASLSQFKFFNVNKAEETAQGKCARKLDFSDPQKSVEKEPELKPEMLPELRSDNDQLQSDISCNFFEAMLESNLNADSTVNSIFDDELPIHTFSMPSTDWVMESRHPEGFRPFGDELFPLSMMY